MEWWAKTRTGEKRRRGCHVTRRRGSVTLSVSQGDGCTLLGPAAPPALSEEPAAPDTDTSSHTDRPNMTRLRSRHRRGLTAHGDTKRRRDGGISMRGGKYIQTESVSAELDEHSSAQAKRTSSRSQRPDTLIGKKIVVAL